MTEYPVEAEKQCRRLASSIIAAIQARPDVLGGRTVDVPDVSGAAFEHSVGGNKEPRPKAYRYVEHVGTLDQNREMKALIQQFREVEDSLVWGQAPGYTVDNVGQDFLDNYCHALLSGPDGPLRCERPLGAFVLFGPHTLYKDHAHTPNEVYLALTGGGEWRIAEHPWRELDAGQSIFIPSNAVHAIRTGPEPLLTFSFWLESADMESIRI